MVAKRSKSVVRTLGKSSPDTAGKAFRIRAVPGSDFHAPGKQVADLGDIPQIPNGARTYGRTGTSEMTPDRHGTVFFRPPEDPQQRLIRRAVEIVRNGGLMVYPTDSCYALGCHIGDKTAMERIRRIRRVDEHHHFTLVCRDLSELGQYAVVDNAQYRSLKAATPGSYTFILKATREVPKRLLNPRRKTIGLRVPDHAVVRALLEEMREPILSSTLILPGDEAPLNDGEKSAAASNTTWI